MANTVVIRQPQPQEHEAVRSLIENIATETFRDLFAPNPVPLDFEGDDWSLAWVAVAKDKIVGVVLTREEWISDLWVLPENRRRGVGSRLLAMGESEIAARGWKTCRLRVVKSNQVAVRFYLGRGWKVAREFPHEKYNHAMFELAKLSQSEAAPR